MDATILAGGGGEVDWRWLPNEVWTMIFGFVISTSKQVCDLVSCARTCKEWKEMALGSYLWKPILRHRLGCHDAQLQLTLRGFQAADDIIDLVAIDPWAVAKQTFQCYLCRGPAEHTPYVTRYDFYHRPTDKAREPAEPVSGSKPVLVCRRCRGDGTTTEIYQTAAEKEYGMTRAELLQLPHVRCFNSHNPLKGLTRCYLREYVKHAALAKYGGETEFDRAIDNRRSVAKKRRLNAHRRMEQRLDEVTRYLAERGISIDDVPLACESIQVSTPTPAVDADPVIVEGRSPRVRAVLVGINYVGTPNELNGCVNDTIHLQSLLKTGGADIDIHMLNDAGYNGQRQPPAGSRLPTKANILAELEWLVSDAVAGDRLLFHFSGHGTQTVDRSGDEEDGMDEALCPVDFNACGDWEQGLIIDDDIKNSIARLPEGVFMTLVLDCCHSGTAADLRYSYPDITTGKMRVSQPHGETRADVVAISGCQDYQTSADAFLPPPLPRALRAQGALTNHLLQTMYDHPKGLSYAEFMRTMCNAIRADNFTQRPLLTSGRPLDLGKLFGLYEFVPLLARNA